MVAFVDPTTALGSTLAPGNVKVPVRPHAHKHAHHPKKPAVDVPDHVAAAGVRNAATEVAPAKTAMDRVDGVMGTAGTVASVGGLVPFGAMLISPVGKGLGWLGGKAKFLSPLQKVGSGIQAPNNWLSSTSLNDAVPAFVSGPLGKASQATANVTAGPVNWLSEKTGFTGWRFSRNMGVAENSFRQAQNHLGQIDASKLHADIRPHVEALQTHVGSAKGVAGLDHAVIGEQMGHITDAVRKNPAIAKDAGAAFKQFGKFEGQMGKALERHGVAQNWTNIKGGIKAAPGKLGNAKVGHVLMNGSFIAMSGVSIYSDTRTLAHNWASLKQMTADITGEKVESISNSRLLFGKVPAPVAAERSRLIKSYGFKQILDTANIIINLKNISFGKAMAAMAGTQVLSQAGDALMGESILPLYDQMRAAQKAGQEIPPEIYAVFLGQVSKDLKARGGANSPFTQELAMQYAAEKATPAQLVADIDNGKVMHRLHNIIAAHEVQKPVQPSHADRLKGKAAAARTVVGDHTAQLSQEPVTGHETHVR